MSDGVLDIVAIVVVIFMLVFGVFIGYSAKDIDSQKEAWKQGHAEYIINENAVAEFQWLPACSKKKKGNKE